ncbi:hypothetical protein DFH06DRAFT_1151813 [Mycena polygramma]|nr:hypothetical protein DFH06DRAFT_1151813 [Mycena polygramma]
MPTPSRLETVLSLGDDLFLVAFFRYWDPSAIFRLAQLNFRLLNVVRYYRGLLWDVPQFLSCWFSQPLDALKMLDDGPALFCGPSVLQFLDRTWQSQNPSRLDVCVGFAGLAMVGQFLASEGYRFRPGQVKFRVNDFQLVTMLESVHFPGKYLKMDGDKSATQEDHASRVFRFVKSSRASLRIVVVHLVRCELHRFVFSMHSTSLMNFISSTHVVSTFARSTFLERKSFVGSQERTPANDDSTKAEYGWLRTYEGDIGRLVLIGSSVDIDRDAEIGCRFIGDPQCWSMPCQLNESPLEASATLRGPAFEVLDWNTGITRHGSYLRIGEPYVWSSEYAPLRPAGVCSG